MFNVRGLFYVLIGVVVGLAHASPKDRCDAHLTPSNEELRPHWTLGNLPVALAVSAQGGPEGQLRFYSRSDKGVTGGQWFKDDGGQLWFVKKDLIHKELQSSAAVIASKIYAHFGFVVPDIYKIEHEGEFYTVSKFMGPDYFHEELYDWKGGQARELSFVAEFLNDVDRGYNPGNILFSEERGWALIDFGASLGASASGGFKPDTPVISKAVGGLSADVDYQKCLEESKGPAPKTHPWQKVTSFDVFRLEARFKRLTKAKIKEIVALAQYSNSQDARRVIEILHRRRHAFLLWAASLK